MGSEMCIRDSNRYVLVNRVTSMNGSLWPQNWDLEPRPLYRNVPEGADAPIDMLPGGDDPFVVQADEALPDTFVDEYGEIQRHSMATVEAELV